MATSTGSDVDTGVRIGCAGWSIPSRHAHLFGPGDSHLARYATRFSVVEVNSTFYRPHQARTSERWAATVPDGFRFSIKLSRAITHEARRGSTTAVMTMRRLPDWPGSFMAPGRASGPDWCIFDNTAAGHAVEDAARLQALLAEGVRERQRAEAAAAGR